SASRSLRLRHITSPSQPTPPPPVPALSLHDALPISRPGGPRYSPRHPREWRSCRSWSTRPPPWCTGPGGGRVDQDRQLLHSRGRSEEHTSELQSRFDLVCRLLLEKKRSCTIALVTFL